MIRFAFNYIKKYFKLLLISIILSFIGGCISIVSPIIFGKSLDYIVISKNTTLFLRIVFLMIILSTIQILLTYINGIISMKYNINVIYYMTKDLISKIQQLSIFDFNNAEYMVQRINNDCTSIINFISNNISDILTKSLSVIVTFVFISKLELKYTLLFIIIIPGQICIMILIKILLKEKIYVLKEAQNIFFYQLCRQLKELKVIKVNCLYSFFEKKLNNNFKTFFKKNLGYAKTSYLLDVISKLFLLFIRISVITLGGLDVIKGTISIGTFTILNTYLDMFISSNNYFISLMKSYQDSMVSFFRIKEILDKHVKQDGNVKLEDIEYIQLDNVSLSFGSLKSKELNLILKKGNIYGIRGKNGSGKTTLLNTLIGLSDYDNGIITYNGIPLEDLNIKFLLKNLISVNSQENELIDESIRDNIFLNNTTAIDFQKLNYLSDKLGISNYISNLSKKLNTNFSEIKDRISGGEKQKICLVKTFLKKSSFIILDEPSSALDSKTIINLKEILTKEKKDKIILVVTHDDILNDIFNDVIEL